MRIISRKALRLFQQEYPNATTPVENWRKSIEKQNFKNFAELKQTFSSIDKVGNYYIFDIAGNHYRLIAAIHFNTQTLYIRHILTHEEYNQWKP